MTIAQPNPTAIIGQPEVVERADGSTAASEHSASAPAPFAPVTDAATAEHSAAWLALKAAVESVRPLQQHDGSVTDDADKPAVAAQLANVTAAIRALAPAFDHERDYLDALVADLNRWVAEGLGVPDFLDSLVAFAPAQHRVDGLRHLVVFPMYTQNGSPDRRLEAVLAEVLWPDAVAALEAERFANPLFVPLRLVDFTGGYDTNSAVMFPESVAMRSIPAFTWGAIFQDREAARFRRVVRAAAKVTRLELLPQQQRLLDDQRLAERVFVLWDLVHDRSHMRGDLPFDPFMIKQRMPYFLYSLEELRCDLTAFRACVELASDECATADARELAKLAQSAIVFDRLFRFPLTGSRTRNYDGLGGQLLFAWLHQRGVLHWTDTTLDLDWPELPVAVVALSDAIDELYWRSIDRPKTAHWLAAYELIRGTLTPHPASVWARGLPDAVLAGPPGGFTDAVLDDEFPLSMFYEALEKKLRPVIESTRGITGAD